MAKVNFRNAYRSVPIHPSNFIATGVKWQFAGYERSSHFSSTRLLFGAKRLPNVDFDHAYRSVPIHLSNFIATGVKWQFAGDEGLSTFVTLAYHSVPNRRLKCFTVYHSSYSEWCQGGISTPL